MSPSLGAAAHDSRKKPHTPVFRGERDARCPPRVVAFAYPSRKIQAQLIEFEQSMVIFRQRHARMVERVIGTGGSSCVDYLDATALRYRVFKDLWAVRTFQIRAAALPPIEDASP